MVADTFVYELSYLSQIVTLILEGVFQLRYLSEVCCLIDIFRWFLRGHYLLLIGLAYVLHSLQSRLY